MRHPIRRLLGQGTWYALSNALLKVAGLVLLPIYTDFDYLSADAYGLWSVLLTTQQIAVSVLGLQLAQGLVRFYPEADERAEVVATTWWLTVLFAAGVLVAGWALAPTIPWSDPLLVRLLVAWIVAELLFAIPLNLVRARERAGQYAALSALKLVLFVGFVLLFVVERREGLVGIVAANALASAVALVGGLVLVARAGVFRFRFSRSVTKRLVRFSAPFVAAGLGSLVLNASDRYVLIALRDEVEVALYQLASQFGGVVNMFAVQPLVLAFLPLLYRMDAAQRPPVLALLLKYGAAAVGLLVVGLSLFTPYVLLVMGSDPLYARSVPLIPYVALGFGVFGLSVLFDGVLLLHERSRTTSLQLTAAGVLNVVLNLLLIPSLGALGAALTTLVSYAALFAVRCRSAQRLLPVRYAWESVAAAAVATAVVAGVGVYAPLPDGWPGFLARAGLVAAWGVVLVAGRWFTIAELRDGVRRLRGG